MTGQLIAEAGSGFISANIHAPVSGTVTAVDMVPNGQGLRQMMITIKREGDDWAGRSTAPETIVREYALSARGSSPGSGRPLIIGAGSATFPTHVDSIHSRGKGESLIVISGVECEPYLTSTTMYDAGAR